MIVGPTNTPPTAATFATPTIPSLDPLLLEVQGLGQKFDAPFQERPGWIHMVKETETNPGPGQPFPPPYLTSEQWLELDAKGYVIRSLWTDRDQGGNVIQQSISVGNYSINLTTGESGYNEYSRYLFSTDLLTQELIQAALWIAPALYAASIPSPASPRLLISMLYLMQSNAASHAITSRLN